MQDYTCGNGVKVKRMSKLEYIPGDLVETK